MMAHQAMQEAAPHAARAMKVTAASVLVVLLCAGCNITRRNGKDKEVSIETPLGGMQVKADPARVLDRIGLPQYPNSVVVNRQHGKDDRAADVDMSFGSFHLRVLTLGLQTQEAPQAVEGFYRKALAQYSDVIACRGNQPVGTPVKTGLGLTCSEHENAHSIHLSDDGDVDIDKDKDELQLKAGSKGRQHIVAIKPQDGGTRIQLIALDLPHGDKD